MAEKSQTEIQKLETEIYDLTLKLEKLRADSKPVAIKNYTFKDMNGSTTLLNLFGSKKILFVIHNMGQACRYCTTWADGFNGFLPHLESEFAVALLSKDSPELQRQFANERGWRFRMASHADTDYMKENNVTAEGSNSPGIVCYVREGDQILKKNSSAFGPGDQFCSIWNILSLAGVGEASFTPQFSYWKRPTQMEDGGQNLN